MSADTLPVTPRVPTPETLTIRWIKAALKHYASQKSRHRGARLHSCALLKALARLQGRSDSHVLKRNSHGYAEAEVSQLADVYVLRATQRGLTPEDKFKLYVLVLGGSPVPLPQRYVQAAHALAEATHRHKGHPDFEKWITADQTLVILDAESAKNAYYTFHRHSEILLATGFYDSYLGCSLALALFPLTAAEAEGLRPGEFKLLG
jgi:hypothetical protein